MALSYRKSLDILFCFERLSFAIKFCEWLRTGFIQKKMEFIASHMVSFLENVAIFYEMPLKVRFIEKTKKT